MVSKVVNADSWVIETMIEKSIRLRAESQRLQSEGMEMQARSKEVKNELNKLYQQIYETLLNTSRMTNELPKPKAEIIHLKTWRRQR